ncbi:MAG: hypothetical protein LBF71_03210 [Campylobacteraceae bacterium]|jgi:hypothetical protein|nr:hypothetical protein [Campylobacteraceae bacterium]
MNSKLLLSIQTELNRFNLHNKINLKADTLRFIFSKQYKLSKLKTIGEWIKLKEQHLLYQKLVKRLTAKELTSVYRLKDEDIYFFNCSNPPKYRKACLVIFGISQYPNRSNTKLINKTVSMLKTISSIDICYDTPLEPNIERLKECFTITEYNETTHYINNTGCLLLEKITIYNKQAKNRLNHPLWRIEATITIPTANPEYLYLPLKEFKEIIDIT